MTLCYDVLLCVDVLDAAVAVHIAILFYSSILFVHYYFLRILAHLLAISTRQDESQGNLSIIYI